MTQIPEFEVALEIKGCPNCGGELIQLEYYDYEPGPDTLTFSPMLMCRQCVFTFDMNLQKAALPEEKKVKK